MKHQTSFVKRALSSIIALLIAIPPTYAGTLVSTSDDPILEKAPGRSAWTYLAEKLYEGETDPEMMREKETLSSLLFAEYLDYLNAVGIELASYEISLQGKKEISERGECSDETLKSYNKLLADSAGSDLATFTNAYCNSACRKKAEFDFAQIAHFDQPENGVKSCEETAKEIYDSYNCNELGIKGDDRLAFMTDITDYQSELLGIDSLRGNPNYGADFPVGGDLIGIDLSAFGSGRNARMAPIASGSTTPLRLPSKPSQLDLLSSKTSADGDFKNLLSKKKSACKKTQNDSLRQTFSQFDGSSRTPIGGARNPLDPKWTSTPEDKPKEKNDSPKTQQKNPACTFSVPEKADHYSKIRSAYMKFSVEKIYTSLAHWPIFGEDFSIQKEYLRLITSTADQLFFPLIDDLEAKYNKACGEGGSISMVAAPTGGNTTIGGRDYTVKITNGEPKKVDETDQPKKTEEPGESPETIATYFNANNSVAESFVDGVFGSPQTGAGTPTEIRAGELAKDVNDGTVSRDDISGEAMKGPLGRNSKEIEAKAREYLEQGNYQGIKIMAAEIAGSIISGALIRVGVKGGSILAGKAVGLAKGTLGGGKLSTLLTAVKESTMRPMLPGRQTGAVSISSFKKLTVNWDHIFSGHVAGGSRLAEGSGKTLFPSHMSEGAIKRAVEFAYRTGKKVGRQLDTLTIEGRAAGLNIRIYYNTATQTIESAFPFLD